MSGNSSPSQSTDTSLSLSPSLLPEKNTANAQSQRSEQHEQQQSSISEHISSINSLENDRSLLEIEISNIPELHTIIGDNDADLINASPPLSLNLSNLSNSAGKNVKSVLEEILHNEQFRSEKSERLDSNDDVSLNIFDGVNLDDSSINNYVRRLKHQDDVFSYSDDAKVRSLEDALSAKDSIIQALNVEVESLKDMASNPSTLSMNTTLTEYKMFQEECATKFVNFESALAHRDALIEKLKDSLIGAQRQEEEMRADCEQYSKDIQCVQKELAEAVEYIKKCKCKLPSAASTSDKRRDEDIDDESLNAVYAQLEERLGADNAEFLAEIKRNICDYVEVKLNRNDSVRQVEMGKLQAKHVKDMDDTRRFYEKKCADMMSDELVSQHSRKIDEDLPSEDDISDFYGDFTSNQKKLTPEAVQAFKKKVDAASQVLSKYDMENLGEEALHSLKSTVDSFQVPLLNAQEVEAQYLGEMDKLRRELQALQQEKEMRDTFTQANEGEHEIDGIVQSYKARLAEQVELAKADIMLALEENISELAASNCDDSDWPKEFLEIRNKLSAQFKEEAATLKVLHEREVTRLQTDLKKARSRIKYPEALYDNDDIVKERTTTNTLRNLLIDCHEYFSQCEEEINATLFEEFSKNSNVDIDADYDTSASSTSKSDGSLLRRVHLVPNIQNFIEKIENNDDNVSLEFRDELNACLHRLKAEANAILALSGRKSDATLAIAAGSQSVKRDEKERPLDEQMLCLTEQVATDAQAKDELNAQLSEARALVKSLEMERNLLDKQMEGVIAKNRITEGELAKARDKIGELIEYGRKEIVSEGYGENVLHGGVVRTPLAELNDRARQIIAENKDEAKTLQLIEELCRECNQLVEDAKREHLDFTLQIDSADKKLKSTQRFLEEQAAEREQERDEAHRTVSALREQLKDAQKDRAGYERVNEVTPEGLGDETQRTFVQYVQAQVEGFEQQMHEMSGLIQDGERRYQEVNTEREEAIEKIGLLRDIIKDLEKQIKGKEDLEAELKFLLEKQREANDDLVQQLETASNTSNFQSHIVLLEEEVSKLRRASDIVGNEGLIKQIQLQLHELELSVDKSIREIESLYATRSTTTCSTPSEEMSVQDQIRPKTPNSSVDDCEVPLQQLARLKEKLLKHSRAENSAIKRIQDMELQLLHAKQEQDDLHSEKDVLQEQVSEQLVLISSLQMRLDDQRIRAEHLQKQANASLEMRIYDLENDLQAMQDKLQSRESTIKQLNKIIDETKQRLMDREDELSTTMEESEVRDLKAQIDRLKVDNEVLLQKIESDAQNAHILPSLVDNIIADKNKDMEILRSRLQFTERQLETLQSMNVDQTDGSRGTSSYFNVSSPEHLRSAGSASSLNVTKFVPEMSSIEKVGPPNVNYTTDASLMKPNSTEIQKTIERHVHFQDDTLPPVAPADTAALNSLTEELQQVKEKLTEAETTISEIRVDLAEAKMHLTQRERETHNLLEDAKRKDNMYMKLAMEKRELDKQFEALDEIRDSIRELQQNEQELKNILEATREKYAVMEMSYNKLQKEFANYRIVKEEELLKCTEENKERCDSVMNDFKLLSVELNACQAQHTEEINHLKRMLEDRESELEILNEDVARYQNEISEYKEKPNAQLNIVVHKKELAEKDLEIIKLTATIDSLKRETSNILDHLIAKEEIIDTMKVDSEALRINLETIKAKMNETGNIYDLQEKLVRERELNAQLHAENEAAIDEVADQVRQQLSDSAQLDDKLFTVLSSGDFNTITDHEREHEVLQMSLNKERQTRVVLEAKIRDLESKLSESQVEIKQLQDALGDQKKLFDHVQVEDTNMMSQIRAKLEEAMENAMEYESQLTKEKALRAQLENEVTMLRWNSGSVSTTSTTEYISLGNLQEQRLQREVKQLQAEGDNLKREIKSLKKGKNTAECELKYNKEMLNLKSVEVNELEKRLAECEAEVRKLQEELRQHKQELEVKTWEAENSRSLISSLEQEKLQLSMQISLLEAKQPAQSTTSVPDVFLQKMKDLGELVTEHINENKLMSDTIAKLTNERNQLEGKIRLLEDRDQHPLVHAPFDDPIARANHLFGKYLRAESYRHALSYQKRFLIGLLATYQDAIGRPLSKFEPKRRHPQSKGVNRFRAVAVVFIAIFRMKYMVQRWHSGSRSGAYMSLQRRFRGGGGSGDHLGTHFQVGKPVSGEHFRIGLRSNLVALRQVPGVPVNQGASTSGIPWSGMSPPSKDAAQRISTKPDHETFEQLRPPAVELDTYFERFNLIQQRLGTTLNSFHS